MKRIMNFVFIFIVSLILAGCHSKEPKVSESSELKFDVEVNYEDVCFIMTYDFGQEENNFAETGFIYAINYEGEDKLSFETEDIRFRLIDIDKEDKKCTISIISTSDAKTNNIYNYTFRGYIKRSNGNIIYSEEQEEVVVDASKIIFALDLNIDFDNYKLIDVNHDVSVNIKYVNDNINLEIIPNNKQIFFSHLEVTINGKLIATSKYKIEDGNLYIDFNKQTVNDIIYKIDLNIDLEKYKLISVNRDVTVNIKPTSDYININIEVITKNKETFSDNLQVIINGEAIDANKFKIENGKLLITIKDPNWTDIY